MSSLVTLLGLRQLIGWRGTSRLYTPTQVVSAGAKLCDGLECIQARSFVVTVSWVTMESATRALTSLAVLCVVWSVGARAAGRPQQHKQPAPFYYFSRCDLHALHHRCKRVLFLCTLPRRELVDSACTDTLDVLTYSMSLCVGRCLR